MNVLPVQWVTHPRHLPKAPSGRAVVVDVAFAADGQWKSKTKPFIDAILPRLVKWVDHHEHREAWPKYIDDERFLLLPNKQAHACPELITEALVEESETARGKAEIVVAHADFDGALAAAKWCLRGKSPWPEADEDARAVDSPGRGHTLSAHGLLLSQAMDEMAVLGDRGARTDFLTRIVENIVRGDDDIVLTEEIAGLAKRSQAAEADARRVADEKGKFEGDDVYVVRVDAVIDNRLRRNLLLEAEARARVGCVYEVDKEGVHWLIAATFDEGIDLEDVDGFSGGRSDYRFAKAKNGGRDLVEKLSVYLKARI